MNSKVTLGIFIALLFGLALLNLAAPKREFSENENRFLQQMPEFSVASLVSGSYTAAIDKYVTDQFVFRDGWVGAKTRAEQVIGKKSSGGVYFTEDGRLIEMFDSVDIDRFESNLRFVSTFTQRAQEAGIRVNTMLVPTASAILADRLPAYAPEVDQYALLEQAAREIDGFVDVSGALFEHSDEYIYYHTDHHWTSLGAFYAYNALREAGGEAPRTQDEYETEALSDSFFGTTWSKASLYSVPPDTITAWRPVNSGAIRVEYNSGEDVADGIYEYAFLDKKDQYSVFLNANQPVVQIQTDVGNGRRLLVVKDSYANTFAQFLLTDYEEIVVLDLRYFHASVIEYAEENNITDALVLYNLKGFSSDANVYFIAAQV